MRAREMLEIEYLQSVWKYIIISLTVFRNDVNFADNCDGGFFFLYFSFFLLFPFFGEFVRNNSQGLFVRINVSHFRSPDSVNTIR